MTAVMRWCVAGDLQMGNELLLHWTQAGPGSGGAEPHSLELPVDRFTADTSSSGLRLRPATPRPP